MSGPTMQNAVVAAVAGLFAHTGLKVESVLLKAGLVVKFTGGRCFSESVFFALNEADAVAKAVSHASTYKAENEARPFAELCEGGCA